ncbi:SRPBCC domain-containing protein [Nocardiopsis sp. N85]|uniref:SRPBCC domain-containing protein n=1 Tax=Nocardiopsis sp. N85 TaxID=3029400 RepID=UPI00237F6A5B|nr:SRPBCC domain-containing protein [Nocardiopsis sp. N85]MDE3720756.1 SRPBCC domain-containing protein [Nocardiopsis sp. N85]
MDVQQRIDAAGRTVTISGAGDETTVTIAHDYATSIEDLWDACTNAERLPRWFAPVSGDLREGGTYQVQDNAGGRILSCDPPKAFHVSWEFDGQRSDVHVRLTPLASEDGGERTRFELSHVAPLTEFWDRFGPGAAGVGWDLGLLGLTLHLESGVDMPAEASEWGTSPEALRFMELSARDWERAHLATGADPEAVRAAAERTIEFYTRPPAEDPEQG